MSTANRFTPLVLLTLLVAGGATRSGCDSQPPPAAGPREAPEVAVVAVSAEAVTLTTELPGRTAPYLEAEIRPQVSGIIQSRLFEEGQDVVAGQVLYQIDPARYQAAYDRAKAALAVAQAGLPALRARVERFAKALEEHAVSQQDYDEALAALRQGEATIDLRAAEMESARIDLSYTPITAPIAGRIGKSNITAGALVTAHQPVPLATIRQIDPIYVDVTQSSAALLRLKRAWEAGELGMDEAGQRTVRLLLEDGSLYPLEGRLQFRDITVDPATGSYTLRLLFPNPERLLLPGMFVRAVVQEGTLPQAILAPQQGVSRNAKGEPFALVVDQANTVQQRMLTLGRAIGNRWLVLSGLSVGDRLIVEGVQKVRPGDSVRVVLFDDQTAAQQEPANRPQADTR